MYLINAIAFDSEWEVPYEDWQLFKRNFNAFNGRIQNTDFMRSLEEMYIETDNATGFLKPYSGGKYSFAALLPNEDVDIADYIAGLTGESLMAALNSAHKHNEGVQAVMPKFSFEYEIEMNDLLAAMGMPTAFCESGADFSRLGHSSAGNLFISKVLHKTFIEVDEIGTRAAAVTVVEVNDESAGDEPMYVTLDRPFVFAIVDNATNLPVFLGTFITVFRHKPAK
jgi:serpin B